ncbi:MAG: DeoR family transcriptional regulator [Firmicutes bacterium]|jgi:DeoR/GlpR family transcriptional regulator of sugar metabolism|nr:DeoR family transcriptional regulator [Bacillota bacterium]
MLPKKRLDLIKQIITNDKKVFVSKLSEKFNVTEETIRKDLQKLELDGVVTRTHGGAVLNFEKTAEGINFYKRMGINAEAKTDIAIKAASCIKNRLTIGVDSSSTAMGVVKLIKDRQEVTILTNSAEALRELAQSNLKVLSTGGFLNKSSLSLQGPVAKNTMKSYHADVALISCKGMDKDKGIFDSDEAEVELKQLLIQQASMVILLVDHTKFDKTAFVKLMDFEEVDLLITDKEPGKEWLDLLQSNEIEVVF